MPLHKAKALSREETYCLSSFDSQFSAEECLEQINRAYPHQCFISQLIDVILWLSLKEGKMNNLVPFAATQIYKLIQSPFLCINILLQSFLNFHVPPSGILIQTHTPRAQRGLGQTNLVFYLKHSHCLNTSVFSLCLHYLRSSKTDIARQGAKFILQLQMHPTLLCVLQRLCTPV